MQDILVLVLRALIPLGIIGLAFGAVIGIAGKYMQDQSRYE